MSASKHVVLNVPDISCNHCKMAIEGAVSALDGVERVEAEVRTKSVDLHFDPGRLSLDAVRAAIEEEGYTVAGEHEFSS